MARGLPSALFCLYVFTSDESENAEAVLRWPGDEEMGPSTRMVKQRTGNMWLRPKREDNHTDVKRPRKVLWGDSFRGRC